MRTSNRHFMTLQTTSYDHGVGVRWPSSRGSVFSFFGSFASRVLLLFFLVGTSSPSSGPPDASEPAVLLCLFLRGKKKTNLMLSFQAGGKGYVYILVQKRFVDCSKTKWNKLRNPTNTTTTRVQKAQNANKQTRMRRENKWTVLNVGKKEAVSPPLSVSFLIGW